MTKRENPTRTCTVCGTEKPISAFLQLGGKQGASYGTICATCRGTGAGKAVREEEPGSTSPATAGLRIGAKERVEFELQQKRVQQERETLQKEEKEKREELFNKELTETEQQEKAEKSTREDYLETKNKFLNYQSKTAPLGNRSVITQRRDERPAGTLIDERQFTATESIKVEEANKEVERKTTFDLSGAPVIDQPDATISRNNPFADAMAAWLGDTPLSRTKSRVFGKSLSKQQKDAQKQKTQQQGQSDKEAREFVENTWGPSRKR